MEKKAKNNWPALIFMFIFMILAAVVEGTRGVFAPDFKNEFGVNDTQIGYIFIIASATYMVATYFGGTLCEKIGQKKVFIIGLISIILSLFGLAFCTSFIQLLVAVAVSSIGTGLVGIACNTILPVVVLTFQVILMNVMHFCYGFGAFIGQSIAGVLSGYNITWHKMYFGVAITYIIVAIVFIFIVKLPHVGVHETEESKLNFKDVIGNKLIVAYILALGFYMFAEQGTMNWFVSYMQSFSLDASKSKFFASAFSLIFAIGRLFGGLVVEKKGYFNVLTKSVFLGSIIYVVGIFLGVNGLMLISLAGLFYSITFPTAVLSLSKVFTEKTAYITGVVVSGATCLTMVLNFSVGKLSDTIGVDKAFYIVPVSGILSALVMVFIYRATKEVLVKKN